MVKIDVFEINFAKPNNDVFFAGDVLCGIAIIVLREPKKIAEILLEFKGAAKTAWSKHSGKARQNFALSEPYFCEQTNTGYTHVFGVNPIERTLPPGRHEIPFRFQLPANLPTSFEGTYGHVRYTCSVTLERPWDFDIVCRRAFSVIGIEDLNDNKSAVEQVRLRDTEFIVRYCCRKRGIILVNLFLPKKGYVPGEQIQFNAEIANNSDKTVKYSSARIKQHVCYRAKSFAGQEVVKHETFELVKKDKGPIKAFQKEVWNNETLVVPPVAPKLMRCKAIDVSYTLELEVAPSIVVIAPLIIGTIPLVGTIADIQLQAQLTPEEDTKSFLSSNSHCNSFSRISSKYSNQQTPTFEESIFGKIDIREGKNDRATHGSFWFTPKYPCYRNLKNN